MVTVAGIQEAAMDGDGSDSEAESEAGGCYVGDEIKDDSDIFDLSN